MHLLFYTEIYTPHPHLLINIEFKIEIELNCSLISIFKGKRLWLMRLFLSVIIITILGLKGPDYIKVQTSYALAIFTCSFVENRKDL